MGTIRDVGNNNQYQTKIKLEESQTVSAERPLAGLLTPEALARVLSDEMRGYREAFVDVPMPRGYHERTKSIREMGLDPIHCPVCAWPGIVVAEDDRGILVNHHGRMFACRISA